MTIKIKFINPFGTPRYNGLIMETLTPYLREGTELVVVNTSHCPENIDYYYSKHLIEEVTLPLFRESHSREIYAARPC